MKMTQGAGIYLLRNKLNNKIYIGKSINLRRRLWQHKVSETSPHYYATYPINNAIRKYKWINFDVEILESFEIYIDDKILLEKEKYYIEKFNALNNKVGYNLLPFGTSSAGIPKTPDHRKKLSLAKMGKIGKKHSEETKEKLRQINLNRKLILSPESLQKIKEGQKNRNHSKTWKSVKQIDINTNEIIKIWPSINLAAIVLNKPNSTSSISKVCNKTIDKNGRRYLYTAFGYKWEYV